MIYSIDINNNIIMSFADSLLQNFNEYIKVCLDEDNFMINNDIYCNNIDAFYNTSIGENKITIRQNVKEIKRKDKHIYLNKYYEFNEFNEFFVSNFKLINYSDIIPNNIENIEFGLWFNNNVNNLPISLVKIYFNVDFNKKNNNLPINLISLIYCESYNKNTNNCPSNLTFLLFNFTFNRNLNNLPYSLKCLNINYCDFNKNVDKLPSNLIELFLTNKFNKNIENLPNKLIKLNLGKSFNQPIDFLPESLQILVIRYLKLDIS